MVCPVCYQDYISHCSNSITVNAQLDPDTEYKWLIEDKFGHQYSGLVTTDGDGLAVIDVSELPEGLLTPHSGFFNITILPVLIPGSTLIPENLTIGSTVYPCIEFYIEGGNHVKTYLGEYTEEAASS